MMTSLRSCPVCGCEEFGFSQILWPELIERWELTPHETEYIDRQQGVHCVKCGCNLRTMALGQAIAKVIGPVDDWHHVLNYRVLEVNEAGALTPFLSKISGHSLVKWPDVDLRMMRIADRSFEVVVHSDTLEHVDGFDRALRECYRVLRPGGALCFTVPTLYSKLTRSTRGRPPTYHGDGSDEGLRVHTEFGADVWAFCLATGFESVEFTCIDWPAGIAITARK